MEQMKDLTKYIINNNSTIKEAILKIENNHSGFVLISNHENQIVGITTDGDIRRRLLEEGDLDQSIENCTNKNFVFSEEGITHENIYKKLDNNIKFIPILNEKKELVSIISRNNIPTRDEKEFYARAKSPVRISFGGGGSDITSFFKDDNGAVINSTISLYCHATLYKRNDKKIIIDSIDLDQKVEYEDLNHLKQQQDKFKLINALIKIIKPKYGFELIIQSDFPISSGLGGSSVVLSALIGCFNEFRNDKWTPYEIAEIAFEAERVHLGISGGWQDQYATVFGGLNFIEFRADENIVLPIRLPEDSINELEESLVLCYTKTNHDSNQIHENQKLKSSKKEIKDNIKANVSLTYEMRNLLLKSDFISLGKCMDKAWQYKKTFSSKITNSYLNKIYDDALKNGAVGGKLLGVGGGGYFLFFVPSSSRNKLIKWINKSGLGYTPFRFENKGLKSWSVRKL